MTEATFQYNTVQDVDCSFCLPADIILCVADGLLLFGSTLEAQITTKTKGATSCQGVEYSYTISYDSDLLADPEIVLNGCHVAGIICKNCFTTYIEDKVLATGCIAPELFGAVRDGATDDTEAFQNAIDYLYDTFGGGDICLSAGTYLVSSVAVKSNINIIGEGPKVSIIKSNVSSSSTGALQLLTSASNTHHNHFQNFKLLAGDIANVGIKGPETAEYLADFYIDNFEIEGFTYGIYISQGLQMEISRGRIIGAGAIGIGIQLGDRSITSDEIVNTAKISNVYISGSEYGLYLDGSVHSIENITIDDVTTCIYAGVRLTLEGGCWLQTPGTFIETPSGNWPIVSINTYFLDGTATEVSDPRSMCSLAGGVLDLAIINPRRLSGQIYVPTNAGTPVTAPTAQTGFAPLVVDTTNNKLYFYSNGAWRDAGP